MTPIEEVEEAIGTLERLKAESTPGEWWATRDLRWPDVFAGPGLSDDVMVVQEARLPEDARLIATMHRTINSLLAILRDDYESSVRVELGPNRLVLGLARAINGNPETGGSRNG